jgi:hypothetical protein
VPSRGYRGYPAAAGLHCLVRLYEMAIQGATKGATKCNIGCYIFPTFKVIGFKPSVECSTENGQEPMFSQASQGQKMKRVSQ